MSCVPVVLHVKKLFLWSQFFQKFCLFGSEIFFEISKSLRCAKIQPAKSNRRRFQILNIFEFSKYNRRALKIVCPFKYLRFWKYNCRFFKSWKYLKSRCRANYILNNLKMLKIIKHHNWLRSRYFFCLWNVSIYLMLNN